MRDEDIVEIHGLDGYGASRDGRIWSLRRNGWREMSGSSQSKGYRRVHCGGVDFLVHRLVLAAFHGPCPEGMQARHLNGDKLDNRAENLAWGTPSENAADKIRHGTCQVGESHPQARLTITEIDAIRDDPRPHKVIAAEYGVERSNISKIKARQSWAHV